MNKTLIGDFKYFDFDEKIFYSETKLINRYTADGNIFQYNYRYPSNLVAGL